MPADRLIHPRLGHSSKVSDLTDLEYRVYMQSLLSADDFGVLTCSAVRIQADNDALAARSQRSINKALSSLIAIGLLIEFTHQGRKYACHPHWQVYQKVEHPRETFSPRPPDDVLAQCSESTRRLFSRWPKPKRNELSSNLESDLPNTSVTVTEEFQNDTETDPRLAHARVRETAYGKRQTANGKRLTATYSQAFDRFWSSYPRKVGKGDAERVWARLRPSEDLVTQILAAVNQQRGSPQWLKDGGQFIPHPGTWLRQQRWKDEPTEVPGVSGASVSVVQMLQRKVVYDA